MPKKQTAAKVKAQLAMAAFIVVTIATLTLTSAGLFEYVALNAGVQESSNPAAVQSLPFEAVTLSPNLTALQGN